MVDVMALEELHKLIGSKWRAIVSVKHARQSLLRDELLQVHWTVTGWTWWILYVKRGTC